MKILNPIVGTVSKNAISIDGLQIPSPHFSLLKHRAYFNRCCYKYKNYSKTVAGENCFENYARQIALFINMHLTF